MALWPAPQSSEEPVNKTIQVYMDTLHATQRESNLTTTMLQDIPTYDGQDSSKLEDWFMDIEKTTDILTESHTYLAKAKSHSLTHMLICEVTQTGKCWDEIKGILRFKIWQCKHPHLYSHFMEIQQKDNETLAAYIHALKTAAKWCAFDNDTAAIFIFVKGLRYAPTITSKIYEDHQTLAEVLRLVEKLSAAHQLTATLTPSTVSMMFGDDRCFVCWWTGHFGHHCPDAQCYGSDEFSPLPRTVPTRFLNQECHTTMTYLIQCIDTPTTRGTDHTPIMSLYRRHFSRSHSGPHSHCNSSSSLRRHTICSSSRHHGSLHHPQLMDAPVTPPAVIPTDIVTPHPTLTISPAGVTSLQRLEPVLLQQLPLHSIRISTQKSHTVPKTFNTPSCHYSKTVTIQDCPSDSSPDSDSDSDHLNY